MEPEVISSGELELEVYPSIGGSIGRFSCEQCLRLEPDRLFYELSIVNLDRSEMLVGLHPFFPASGQARVRGLFDGCWNCDDQGLPYRFSLIDEPDPLSGNLTMAEVEFDPIYVGSRSDIKVRWDSRSYALTALSPDHA